MKKALVNPKVEAQYIVDWVIKNNQQVPVYETYPNSHLICDISDKEFPVTSPLYWLDCDDSIEAYRYYVNTVSNKILPIEDVSLTILPQPNTNLETI